MTTRQKKRIVSSYTLCFKLLNVIPKDLQRYKHVKKGLYLTAVDLSSVLINTVVITKLIIKKSDCSTPVKIHGQLVIFTWQQKLRSTSDIYLATKIKVN